MAFNFDLRYPSVNDLRSKAQERIPKFAFEYLDGGCNEDVNIKRNTSDIREIQLKPRYLRQFQAASLKTKIMGIEYNAPFGIAPIGLQGLMWPGAPEILAKAAHEHNIPFVLSTVSTASIESIAEITEGKAWFQLYNPSKTEHRKDIIQRAQQAAYPVLVVLCDVPTFGFRPRDIKNGLSMPPRMTLSNVIQILQRPVWATRTFLHGKPAFETLKPYMDKSMNMKQLGRFMDEMFSGRLDRDRLQEIRDLWPGKMVLKGVASEEDAQIAQEVGLDGIVVSNHGGRQLDAGESSLSSADAIVKKYSQQMEVMLDSGIRSGADVARVLASGLSFTFLGRSFMYSVAALGRKGGEHAIEMLKTELTQVLEQLCCEDVAKLPEHLIK